MRIRQIINLILNAYYKLKIVISRKFNVGSFRSDIQIYKKNKEYLKPFSDEYNLKISTKEMAVSLETGTSLLTMCELKKPKRILDLGSGFSSFIFRTYQKKYNPSAEVYSIDDDINWLEKTKNYLTDKNVDTNNIKLLNEFESNVKNTFDFIFHDIGSMNVRKNTLSFVLGILEENGILILDDMHKKDYAEFVNNTLNKNSGKHIYIKKFTFDKLGRYSTVFIK